MDNNSWYDELIEDTEAYRDRIATVDEKGKRIWIYPKKPKGRFYNYRSWASYLFLILFLTMPFLKVDGEQFLLFNVIERKFVLFGILFTPQDFHLFALAMLTLFVFIILFTVVYGRLFCGWACPQTVFMEMVFRKIEYWIEGDANQQRKLDKAPWNAQKIRKKGLKHAIFFAIAFVVSNYFLAYIIGSDAVIKIITEPVSQNLGGFIGMLIFSGVFYFVFSRLREQVCTTICPYGRLQGVLLVKDSIVVAYDHVRGEPRTRLKKKRNPVEEIQSATTPAAGDCIDCKLCIAVCPTGIDIRDGTQLECVNCTACIDACDEVMDKVDRPRGLIRYDSMKGIETKSRKIFTPRVWAYSAVLLALISLDIALIANRGTIESIILRSPGQLYQSRGEDQLTNLYTFKLINKSPDPLPVEIRLKNEFGKIELVGKPPADIPKGEIAQGAFFIVMPRDKVNGRKTPLVLEVYSNGEKIDQVKTNFMGPPK